MALTKRKTKTTAEYPWEVHLESLFRIIEWGAVTPVSECL